MKLYTFEEVLKQESSSSHRHLLLGNGFSIACRKDIFTYGALFEKANFKKCSKKVREAFDVLKTKDFETVMRALQTASKLTKLYSSKDKELCKLLLKESDTLKELLINTIAKNHPEMPSSILDNSYNSCRHFLCNFNNIYTINYDLLLYWAGMHEESEYSFDFDDGFRTPDTGGEEYVTWEIEKTDRQNIHYLHGALHIFDVGDEIKKYTWINTGIRLIEQIRSALSDGMFPLIVTEGESKQKLARINHSNLLSRSYRSFAKIGNSLYIYGHSMAENDEHILHLIDKNRKLKNLFVGIYGDPESIENKHIIKRSKKIERIHKPYKYPSKVIYFDANTAKVWE